MNYYKPDGWALLKIQVEGCDSLVKVFASWSGGYTSGDSWRVNSGCTKIEENETAYIAYGYSGSEYVLSKNSNYITSYNREILEDMIGELLSYGHKAEVISVEEARKIIGA